MKNKFFILFAFCGILILNSCSKDDTVPSADLMVTQTVSTLTPIIGTNITFTVVAHNNGPSDATGVDVTNNLPTGYTVVNATATVGTYNGTWVIGKLANGQSATLTMIVTVKPTGTYPSAVSILGAETDPSVSNNSSIVTPVPVAAKITYLADVKPIFVASCTPCHMAGGANPNKWDDYTMSKSKIDVILDRVQRTPGTGGFMPKVGSKLTDAQIATLKQWVTDGLVEK
jgi:uncharacterized repeat protein (TIGR01451 family)